MRFAKEVVGILRDPLSRSSGQDSSASPAKIVVITAGGFAFCGGCSFTDDQLVEKCLKQEREHAYFVRLVYKFNSGGVEIVRVGTVDAVLKQEDRNRKKPTATVFESHKLIPRRKLKPQEPTQSNTETLDLVYRRVPHKPEFVIIALKTRAFHTHKIWIAIKKAKTWKQFASMLPDGEWRRLRDLIEDKPNGSESFNAEMLPGYSDGDYPPWLQTEIAQCLPAIVREEFSLRSDSVLNGPFWEIPADIEVPLIDRLRSLGYSVEQREDWFFY
jgi:hypothetical protein